MGTEVAIYIAFGLAAGAALLGVLWLVRIGREGSEPESNDHHWWSR